MKPYFETGRMPVAAAAVFIAVVICYGATVRGGFLFDDFPQIVENTDIREIGNIPALFVKGVWDPSRWSVRLYRPLAFAGWSVEYALGGAGAFVYHLTNIILHFICSLLVYALLNRLTAGNMPSLAGALVFAVHPVHSEVVGWVACRMELMYTLFLLAAILLFMRKPYRRVQDWTAALLFLLALMSKEAAAAFPGVLVAYMLLYDLPDKGRMRHMAARLYPFAVMLAVYMAARVHAVGTVAAGSEASVFYGVPGYYVFLTMCKALTQYVRLTIFPFNLTIDYIFEPVAGFFRPDVLFALAGLAAAALFWRRLRGLSRPAALGLAIFLVMLVPVSNIVILPNIMSERALYMPSVAFSILVAELVRHAPGGRLRTGGMNMGWAYMPVAGVILLFGMLTIERSKYWYDPDTFAQEEMKRYERRIGMFPDYMEYYTNYLETAISQGGMQDEGLKVADEAVRRFDDPGLYSLAAELCRLRKDAGLACGKLPEGLPAAKYTLAADAFMKHGMPEESLELIGRSVALEPDNPETCLKAGIILGAGEQFADAARLLEKAVALDPGNPDGHYYLAVAYYGLDRTSDARGALERALKLDPSHTRAAALMAVLG